MSKNKIITITLPESIIKKVEEDAKENKRSRSNQIAVILSDYYENKAIKYNSAQFKR